jgi:hypothetical protein
MNNWKLPNRVFCDTCKKIRPFAVDYMGCATDIVCDKCHGPVATFHEKAHRKPCGERDDVSLEKAAEPSDD